MTETWFELNKETGVIEKLSGDKPRSGRWRMISGDLVRIGEGRPPSDRSFSAKESFACGAGVKSPADGKMYYDVRSYENSVERMGCRIVGNDARATPAKKEIAGEYNVRDELTKATRQVLSKQ